MKQIVELVKRLKRHPQIVGLVEYGSAHFDENFMSGDYDLFVIHDDLKTEVESLHFYVEGVPVDLNIRSIRSLHSQEALSGFEVTLLDGRIIYDELGAIAGTLGRLQKKPLIAYTEHDVAFVRHGHRHALDKIKNRLESEPLLCRLLLNTNIYWLLQSYFGIRQMQYKGEKKALAYLSKHEPEIYSLMQQFYNAGLVERLAITEQLTELVLSPVGGAWQAGEILTFGEGVNDLQNKGERLFEDLMQD